MRKLRLFSTILLAGCMLDILLGIYFRTGKVMAISSNPNLARQQIVKIREIRMFPLWAFPLAILDDNPQYRFEYYEYSYRGIWSCQSFVGESFRANSAQIEWSAEDVATVSLDHNPIFACKNGVWTSACKR